MTTDDAEEIARKLGAFIETCPVCQVKFDPRPAPRWWITTLHDGEIVETPEEDLFCSEACARKEADRRNQLPKLSYHVTNYVNEDTLAWI